MLGLDGEEVRLGPSLRVLVLALLCARGFGACRAIWRRAPMEFCAALPRTFTGKVNRTRLAKRNR